MSQKQEADSNIKVIALNKKARFQYHIIETCEAGLVLSGAEIKSVRLGQITLNESYVMPWQGELFLHGAHIAPYSHSGAHDYDPTRKRKLLLHKHEIEKFSGRVEAKGLTIVPLRIYLKRGRAKLEIALAKGKDAPDKRESVKAREGKREMERVLKGKGRG